MHVKCTQDHLSQALSSVIRAVGSRPMMPALGNVLLATDGERLKLAATNLDLGISTWIAAPIEEEGTVTVPARLLTDLVHSLPVGEQVELREKDQSRTLTVTCAHSHTQVRGIDPDEFPPIPTTEGEPTVSIERVLLREMIGQVAMAAARDDTRPVLAGVSVELAGSQLTMAAADGFRLAVREATLERELPEPVNIIVPARALQELVRVMGDDDGAVEITVTPNQSQVLFRAGDVVLVSRLIEGQFPNYQQIIPKSHTTRVVVPRRAFSEATRRVSLFARESANVLRLGVEAGGDGDGLVPGQVVIDAQAQDVGEIRDEVDASIEGESTHIAFNAEYLNDLLGVLETDDVVLEVTGPLSPGVIKGADLADYLHVIMPMHTVR